MINPQDLVLVRQQATKAIDKNRELPIDARTALEGLNDAIDGVLAFTSRGVIPTVPAPPKPAVETLEQRVARLERQLKA